MSDVVARFNAVVVISPVCSFKVAADATIVLENVLDPQFSKFSLDKLIHYHLLSYVQFGFCERDPSSIQNTLTFAILINLNLLRKNFEKAQEVQSPSRYENLRSQFSTSNI
jgi:hypothetical protein